MSIRRWMRLRVHGFVQSRDYRESLSDFLEKAQKAGNTAQINLTEVKPEQITIERNVVEIVVRRIIVLDNGERK